MGGALRDDSAGSVVGEGLLGALHFVLAGLPQDARAQADAPFAAWMPVIQAGLLFALPGGWLVFGFDDTLARLTGAVLVAVGGLVALGATLIAAAIASTAPPPRHPGVAEEDGHPLLPAQRVTGLVPWNGVWIAQGPLQLGAIPFSVRMAVIPLEDGLLLWSPIEAADALVAAVREIGPVRWIVAPNPSHHLYLEAWAGAFPDAGVVGPAELAEQHPSLRWEARVDDAHPWQVPGVQTRLFAEAPAGPELVLFHPASGSLFVADLLLLLGHDVADPRLAFAFGLLGLDQRPSPPTHWKLTCADPARVAADAAAVLTWPFERVVIAHGRPVEVGARAAFADALRFARLAG